MTRTAQSHGTSEQILKLAPAAKALQNELTDFSVHFLFCHMHVTNGFCEILQCGFLSPLFILPHACHKWILWSIAMWISQPTFYFATCMSQMDSVKYCNVQKWFPWQLHIITQEIYKLTVLSFESFPLNHGLCTHGWVVRWVRGKFKWSFKQRRLL